MTEPGLQSSGAQPRPEPYQVQMQLVPAEDSGGGGWRDEPRPRAGDRRAHPEAPSAWRGNCEGRPNVALRAQLLNRFFFWPRLVACGILDPQPGIEPTPPVKGRLGLPATGPPGKLSHLSF